MPQYCRNLTATFRCFVAAHLCCTRTGKPLWVVASIGMVPVLCHSGCSARCVPPCALYACTHAGKDNKGAGKKGGNAKRASTSSRRQEGGSGRAGNTIKRMSSAISDISFLSSTESSSRLGGEVETSLEASREKMLEKRRQSFR